jgi:serine phosphatase RsbU (regulator of sigma subunit)
MIPKIGVSADFAEIVTDGSQVWTAIGDMPASGLRSAFLARFVANLFKRLVQAAPNATGSELLAEVGRTIGPFGGVARLPMQCVRIDTARRMLDLASAGQPFPVLYSARRRRCDRLPIRGRLLDGAQSDPAHYESRMAEIAPGDVLVLVTDGLTEAHRLHDPYGYRFTRIVEAHASESARTIGERILADWRSHARQTEWIDDVTVLVAAIRGVEQARYAH